MIAASPSVAVHWQQVEGGHWKPVQIRNQPARIGVDDFFPAGKGDTFDPAQITRGARTKCLHQFDNRYFTFAVDNGIHPSCADGLIGNMAEKASSCYDARPQLPGEAGQAQAFLAGDRFFTDRDKARSQPPQFFLKAAPTHAQRRSIQNGDSQTADLFPEGCRE